MAYPQVPVMVWWTPFSGDTGVQKCGKYSCYVTNVFFYGTSVREADMPLPRRGLDWSLLHEESPKNNLLFSHSDMMSLFNHTSTFRLGSDYPLTTQYLEGLDQINDPTYITPLKHKNEYLTSGLAPVVYVQSGCDAPSRRDEWIKAFMEYVPVDSYGSCLHNKDLPEDLQGSEQFENKNEYLTSGLAPVVYV